MDFDEYVKYLSHFKKQRKMIKDRRKNIIAFVIIIELILSVFGIYFFEYHATIIKVSELMLFAYLAYHLYKSKLSADKGRYLFDVMSIKELNDEECKKLNRDNIRHHHLDDNLVIWINDGNIFERNECCNE